MKERCRDCPHHFFADGERRCYLIRIPVFKDPKDAQGYLPTKSVSCSQCIEAREKYREEKHCEPPKLRTTIHTCSGQHPHPQPYYTIEEIK